MSKYHAADKSEYCIHLQQQQQKKTLNKKSDGGEFPLSHVLLCMSHAAKHASPENPDDKELRLGTRALR